MIDVAVDVTEEGCILTTIAVDGTVVLGRDWGRDR